MLMDYDKLIENGDLAIFRIESQTSLLDRKSLLDCQRIVRSWGERYTYLEVGSHLGGTLLPYILDSRCSAAISIDPRPASQPDERGRSFNYDGNSTERMIQNLTLHANGTQMSKLRTFEIDASALPSTRLNFRARIALIDAEHTNRAVFRDFLSIDPYLEPDGILLFHDSKLIFDALSNIEAFLIYRRAIVGSFYLPENVYAITFGTAIDAAAPILKVQSYDPEVFIEQARINLYNQIVANARHRA